MGNLTNSFTKIGTVLAISSFALVGCTSADAPAPTGQSSATATQKAAERATEEGAATFANEFFAALLMDDGTDYSQLNPPIQLTEEQAEQLMLDGKVDGVSDEDLNELVDYLYENHPLGGFVYFDTEATIQERLQAISALILAQEYATSLSDSEQTPVKILPEDVTIDGSGDGQIASFEASGAALAPTLIFVDGEWKIDGKAILDSFGLGSEVPEDQPAEGADPAPEAEPTPSE